MPSVVWHRRLVDQILGVRTAVLSTSDPEIIVRFIFNTIDGLDGIADVGKVDKRVVLFLEEIDELDVTILAKVANLSSEKVSDVANIHVARRARVHRQGESGWKGTSIFSPTKLESPVVQCQTSA